MTEKYDQKMSAVIDAMCFMHRVGGLDAAKNTEVPPPLEGAKEQTINALDEMEHEVLAGWLAEDGVAEENQLMAMNKERVEDLAKRSGYDPIPFEDGLPDEPGPEYTKKTIEKLLASPAGAPDG